MSGGGIIIAKGGGGPRGPRIPGLFPSVRYGEQVVSTGIPSLDSFLGGGLPLGIICIVFDSFPSRFGDCVLKTFLAEGATYNHHLFVASGREDPVNIASSLPSLLKGTKEESEPGGSSLKIAWRYGQQQTPAGTTTKEIHKFEFSNKKSAAELGATHLTTASWDDISLCDTKSEDLLKEIAMVAGPLQTENKPSNLLRIALSHCEDEVLSSPTFLRGLRAIVRHTNSVAVLTIGETASGSLSLKDWEHFGDYVISLSAVVDEQRRTDFGFIDGICDFKKMTSVNSIKPLDHPKDVAYSYHKSKIFFHEVSLPPEGEKTPQREVASVGSAGGSCGATKKGKPIVDF